VACFDVNLRYNVGTMARRQHGPSGTTNQTPQHRALGSESRAAILHLVQSCDGALTAAEVVDRVGLHPSTVRAHLEQLVDAGLLMKARASDGAPGRPAWRYRAAAPEPAPGPYRTLAAGLVGYLATGGVRLATQAGQEWGERLAASSAPAGGPVGAVMAALDSLGFDPQRHDKAGNGGTGDKAGASGEVDIHLHTCPFLDLVRDQPDVMCALHAGMIRGVVRASGAPRAQAVLEPFATPDACVVRLRLTRSRATDRS